MIYSLICAVHTHCLQRKARGNHLCSRHSPDLDDTLEIANHLDLPLGRTFIIIIIMCKLKFTWLSHFHRHTTILHSQSLILAMAIGESFKKNTRQRHLVKVANIRKLVSTFINLYLYHWRKLISESCNLKNMRLKHGKALRNFEGSW